MAYQMAAMAVHRLQAFSNAAFYTISTDSRSCRSCALAELLVLVTEIKCSFKLLQVFDSNLLLYTGTLCTTWYVNCDVTAW